MGILKSKIRSYSLLKLSVIIALTLILLMWRIWLAANNASKWQMGFNSAFKLLILKHSRITLYN
jgi:uncharacterized membrane protein